jgi:hypothetical protein
MNHWLRAFLFFIALIVIFAFLPTSAAWPAGA